jgi:hypothetical protein
VVASPDVAAAEDVPGRGLACPVAGVTVDRQRLPEPLHGGVVVPEPEVERTEVLGLGGLAGPVARPPVCGERVAVHGEGVGVVGIVSR